MADTDNLKYLEQTLIKDSPRKLIIIHTIGSHWCNNDHFSDEFTVFKPVLKSKIISRRFRVLIKVLQLNDKIIDLALNDNNFKDFEDGLQYYMAIENEQNFIITRDLPDFKESKIPVMTADEYLVSIEL